MCSRRYVALAERLPAYRGAVHSAMERIHRTLHPDDGTASHPQTRTGKPARRVPLGVAAHTVNAQIQPVPASGDAYDLTAAAAAAEARHPQR